MRKLFLALALLGLACGKVWGTVAYVQSFISFYGSSGTSQTGTFSSANTAGNFIVVYALSNSATPSMSVTDTRGNTYHSDIGPITCNDNACSAQSYEIFYAYNIGPQASNTITLHDTQNTGHEFSAGEWSGVATSSPNDGTCSNVPTGNAPSSLSCSITASQSGDLVIGGGISDNSTGGFSAGTGFTLRLSNYTAFESEENASGTSLTVAVSNSTQNVRAILGQAFKASGGAGTPSRPPSLMMMSVGQ